MPGGCESHFGGTPDRFFTHIDDALMFHNRDVPGKSRDAAHAKRGFWRPRGIIDQVAAAGNEYLAGILPAAGMP